MPRAIASASTSSIASFMNRSSSANQHPTKAHKPKPGSASHSLQAAGANHDHDHSSRSTVPESPQHSSRQASPAQVSASDVEPWYAVRDIIDEKKQGRRILYLIDWEDNPVTGEPYSPTWAPAKDVTDDAIRSWEEIKRARQIKSAKVKLAGRKKQTQRSSRVSAAATPESRPTTSSGADDDDDDDAARPKASFRKRFVPDSSDDSDGDGDIPHTAAPAKRLRPGSQNHSQTQSLSQSLSQSQSQSVSHLSSPPFSRSPSADRNGSDDGQDPDALENSVIDLSTAAVVDTVDIVPPADFDDYARLTQCQTQARHPSPQQTARNIASQASARTIPDSQPESALLSTDESQPIVGFSEDDDDDDLDLNHPTEASLRGTSAQPAQEQDFAPTATQVSGLRESVDWTSASAAASSASATSSGSRVEFQTQPEPNFSPLLSQNPQSTQLATHTPISSRPSNPSCSVIPDSTGPARIATSRADVASQDFQSSAQVVPNPYSNEDHLGQSLPDSDRHSQEAEGSKSPQTDMDDGPRKIGRLEQAYLDMMGDPSEFESPSLPSIPSLPEQGDANLASVAARAAATSAPTISSAMLMATSTAPSDPMFNTPLVIGSGVHEPLLSQSITPSDMQLPGAQHLGGTPSGTIAPGDMSFSDPMTLGVLQVSPEPEDSAPIAQDNEDDSGSQPMDEDDIDNEDDNDNDDNDDNGDDASDDEIDMSNPNYTTHEYIVTLPLASNTRQHYLDMISEKANEQTIQQFSSVFSRDIAEVPDAETVARVDELLRKFIDISDMPTFHDSTPGLSDEERMKHAVNTNAKYSFVYEFLERISTLKKTVLILAGRDVVLDYLEAIVNTAGISVERLSATGEAPPEKKTKTRFGTLSVLLGNASSLTVDSLPRADIDIVIGFDHVTRTSGLLDHYMSLSTAGAGDKSLSSSSSSSSASSRRTRGPRLPKPICLLLVSAFTVEHADLRLELTSVDDLERKNALLLCTLECVQYLRENNIDSHLPTAPHDAAKAFGQMVTNPAIELEWQSQPLPDDVFDIYVQSSGTSQPTFTQAESIVGHGAPGSRKRQLDDSSNDSTDGAGTNKRVRVSAPIVEDQARVSDTVKRALGGPLWTAGSSGPSVRVSLDQLEALAAKVTSLQDRLQEKETAEAVLTERVDVLDRLAESRAKTIRTCHDRLLEATKDRGVFESERNTATAALATVQEKLASRTQALAETRAQKTDLEAHVTELNALLASSAQPDVAAMGKLRTELAAANERVASLERKAANADQDLDHARHAYQDASNAATDLSTENRDLSAQMADLQQRASTNLRAIHEAHLRSEAETYRSQWYEAATMLKERQSELEWTREELRVLKNGRRETRQQSVPRSPRLSVMSPRNGHGRAGSSSAGASTPVPGGSGSGGAGFAAAARQSVSRGNSPVSANFDASLHSSPLAAAADNNGSGSGGGGPPVPGMTYLAPSHRGGRMGHLRE